MMMQPNVRLLFMVLLLAAGFGDVVRAESLLRWRFAEGEQWQLAFEQQTESETSGAGKPTRIEMTIQLEMSWKIDAVDANETAQITQRLERFSASLKSGTAEPVEYDSAAGNRPAGAAADLVAPVQSLIGMEFTVTMTSRGAIREVKLSDAAAEAFEKIESPVVKQVFSAERISQLLGQAAVEFPEQPVATGDHWTATLTTPSPLGTLQQERTFTLGGLEDSDGTMRQRIDISGQLQITDREQATGQLKLIGQQLAGSMLFDVQAGRLVDSEVTQKLTTERPYREFQIKVETTAKTTTRLTPR